LDEGLAVGSKELREYMEVLGYGEAADWIYKQALSPEYWQHDKLVTITELRYVHHLCMAKVWEVAPHKNAYDTETPGNFRQHDILSFAGGMKPPSFTFVESQINLWLEAVNTFGELTKAGNIAIAEAPEKLAYLHKEYERIHPFLDGNGRSGRLILNLILLRLGWPPAIILKKQRKRYLAGLDKADAGDYAALAELIAKAVIDSTYHLIPAIAGPVKLVPLETLAGKDISLAALRKAAVRGRLEAILDSSGMYLSSKAAVQRYLESKYKRG
jgi:Fic family protein